MKRTIQVGTQSENAGWDRIPTYVMSMLLRTLSRITKPDPPLFIFGMCLTQVTPITTSTQKKTHDASVTGGVKVYRFERNNNVHLSS